MRVLAIHAHPDDEVLFTGSTLAAFHAAGAETLLLTATLGEAAELGDRVASPAALEEAACRREAKLRASCARLGVWLLEALGGRGRWRDLGRGAEADRRAGATLSAAGGEELARAVQEALARLQPALVLTLGPDGVTGHPDHVRIHDAVRAAHPPRVLAARLRRRDVEEGRRLLAQLLPGERVGSGGLVGTDLPVVPFTAGPQAIAGKRQALDAYAPGLGTLPLSELLARGFTGRGDTLLLRAIFEVTGWAAECFAGP